MKKIFVVILNWNNYVDTLECIKSIDKLNAANFRLNIVVVDNASSDKSADKLSGLKYKNIEMIKNKKNLGFAGGNNVGIRYSLKKNADWVLLLNNDTYVDPSFIGELYKYGEKESRVGVLSPKIYFAKGYEFHKKRYKKNDLGRVIWSAGGSIDWDNVYGKNRGVDEVDQGQYDEVCELDFASGACVFLRASALKEVGLFDEKYFMYFEDVDLCMRMRKFGWRILYVPTSVVWHKVSRSSGIGSALHDYFIMRNRLYFGLKYASLKAKYNLIEESLRVLFNGREWQKKGVLDFYLRRFGKGRWK